MKLSTVSSDSSCMVSQVQEFDKHTKVVRLSVDEKKQSYDANKIRTAHYIYTSKPRVTYTISNWKGE